MKNNLRVLLALNRVTLKELSDATGISTNTLSMLNREVSTNPDSKTLIKIAKYFNVTLDDLVPLKGGERV